ncbi:MAG TPA: outer membrane protein assembly factor BamE [Burkholderiales bacterium]
MFLHLALPCAALILAGCSAESKVNRYVPNVITPYRMDIQQGNFVTTDMVDKLQKGQTQQQVRFILGTPLLTDAFHAQRWDYVFRSSKGWNDPEQHRLTVYFDDGGKLDRWVADDVPPPKALGPVPDDRGFFGGLFGKKSPPTAAATPAPAAPAGAAADAGAAAAPGVGAAAVASTTTPAAPAAVPVPAALPVTAGTVVTAPASTPAIGASAQAEPDKKQPGLMRRMFGWLPGVSTEDSAASVARASSPDNVPTPRPSISQPPPPPEPKTEPTVPPITPPQPAGGGIAPSAATPAPGAPAASGSTSQAPAAPAATLAAPPPIAAAEPPVVQAQSLPNPNGVVAEPTPPAASQAPTAAPAATAPAIVSPDGVLTALERWRAAWQAKNAAAYFAAYAPDFRPPSNLSRAKWEVQRRDRLMKPSFINVKVQDPQVTIGSDDIAVVTFTQVYESNLVKESGRKTLRMARYGSDWLIVEEINR